MYPKHLYIVPGLVNFEQLKGKTIILDGEMKFTPKNRDNMKQEITIPQGTEKISIEQFDNRIVIELIPKFEPKDISVDELYIFWDTDKKYSAIRVLIGLKDELYLDDSGLSWIHCIKFESVKQYLEHKR